MSITIHEAHEPAIERIPNRFDLILVAANRARELHRGSAALIERPEGEKPAVTALREIGAGKLSDEKLLSLRRR